MPDMGGATKGEASRYRHFDLKTLSEAVNAIVIKVPMDQNDPKRMSGTSPCILNRLYSLQSPLYLERGALPIDHRSKIVELISLKEAARLLNVDYQTVRRHFPCIKIGKRCLVRRADIARLLTGGDSEDK